MLEYQSHPGEARRNVSDVEYNTHSPKFIVVVLKRAKFGISTSILFEVTDDFGPIALSSPRLKLEGPAVPRLNCRLCMNTLRCYTAENGLQCVHSLFQAVQQC